MVQQMRNFVVEWQRRLGHDDKQHQASGGESDFHKTTLITGWLEPLGDDDDDRNVMMRRNLVHDLRLRVGQNASLWGAVTPGHNSNLIIGIAFVILAFLFMLIPIKVPDFKYKSLFKIVQCAHMSWTVGENGFIENNIIILIRYCHRNIFEAEGKVFDHPRTVSLSPLLTCYRLDLSSLL